MWLSDPLLFLLGFYFHSAEQDLTHGDNEVIIDFLKMCGSSGALLNCIIPQQALDSPGAVDQTPTVGIKHSTRAIVWLNVTPGENIAATLIHPFSF